MAAYNVKLIIPEGEKVITVPDEVHIPDHVKEEGVDLPYSCRVGSCSSCVWKVVSGTVDQSDDQITARNLRFIFPKTRDLFSEIRNCRAC
ncbi:hypothetical protein K2173_016560 [Erythroxylum novogranatense]|uniref:2Fe-2S ferredoxin-type domain-containing protein n=1 Tax=Erythroxylum novogranatense TaxID=1862640 RepID=A0AAV8SH78_9ROSI|nr:hypothetical protein K2173_016560 [Erythroxylum novogranatense]